MAFREERRLGGLIEVDVRLYATLRKYAPGMGLGQAIELKLNEGTTLGRLFSELGVPRGEVKRCIVNGIAREDDYILRNGDRVAIFPPIAGG